MPYIVNNNIMNEFNCKRKNYEWFSFCIVVLEYFWSICCISGRKENTVVVAAAAS